MSHSTPSTPFACFAVFIIAGPTTLLALCDGTRKNWRVVAMGILGASLSDILLIGAVGLGLGALLGASEVVFSAVKRFGVVYLIWLGIELWRSAPEATSFQPTLPHVLPSAAFSRCLGVDLSNPKALLFFATFLPQFMDTSQPQAIPYRILALASAAFDVLVKTGYIIGGVQAARLLSSVGRRRLNRSCAVAMLSLAGFLARFRRTDAKSRSSGGLPLAPPQLERSASGRTRVAFRPC